MNIYCTTLLITVLFQFPMTAYLVAGSQAAIGRQNHVILVKMSQLVKTHKEDNPNDSADDS